jgi:putative transposase
LRIDRKSSEREKLGQLLCDDWPAPRPANWLQRVQRPQSAREEQAMQLSINRGRPFGDERWQARTARKLELESSLRDPGRPKKTGEFR